jgi:xylose isomerase
MHGAIYFDTFPDTTGLDPIAEAEANIATVAALRLAAARLKDNNELIRSIDNQDPVASIAIVRSAMYRS